jgi:hypothetical protein
MAEFRAADTRSEAIRAEWGPTAPALKAETIHTAKDRQTGRHPSSSYLAAIHYALAPAARRHAQPNLLNVAVSSTKRRLYIIGNPARVGGLQRYFDSHGPHAATQPIYDSHA